MSDYTKHYIEEIQNTIQRAIDYGHTTEEKKEILGKFEQIVQDCLSRHNMDKDFKFELNFNTSGDDGDDYETWHS